MCPTPDLQSPSRPRSRSLRDHLLGSPSNLTPSTVREEREFLTNHDDEGHEDFDQAHFTNIMSDESQYQTRHGRNKCRYDTCAQDVWEVPQMYQQLSILTVILFYEWFEVGGFREKRQWYNISNICIHISRLFILYQDILRFILALCLTVRPILSQSSQLTQGRRLAW